MLGKMHKARSPWTCLGWQQKEKSRTISNNMKSKHRGPLCPSPNKLRRPWCAVKPLKPYQHQTPYQLSQPCGPCSPGMRRISYDMSLRPLSTELRTQQRGSLDRRLQPSTRTSRPGLQTWCRSRTCDRGSRTGRRTSLETKRAQNSNLSRHKAQRNMLPNHLNVLSLNWGLYLRKIRKQRIVRN